MRWVQAAVATAGALAGWRWLIRPIRRGWRELLILLRQVRSSAASAQILAREIEALSGAVVQLVIAVLDDQQAMRVEHLELRDRTRELSELVIDLDADIRRIEKRIGRTTP